MSDQADEQARAIEAACQHTLPSASVGHGRRYEKGACAVCIATALAEAHERAERLQLERNSSRSQLAALRQMHEESLDVMARLQGENRLFADTIHRLQGDVGVEHGRAERLQRERDSFQREAIRIANEGARLQAENVALRTVPTACSCGCHILGDIS